MHLLKGNTKNQCKVIKVFENDQCFYSDRCFSLLCIARTILIMKIEMIEGIILK